MPVNSAFLGTLQSAFVANGVHHEFALGSQIVGDDDEEHKDGAQKQGFPGPAALMQLQAAEAEGGNEQGRQQKDDTGITETVKRFEKLHLGAPELKFELSMTCGAGKDKDNKEKIMSDTSFRPAIVQDAADLAWLDNVASHGLSQWYWRRQALTNDIDEADWMLLSEASMSDPNFPPGWTNAVIAESNGATVGAASGTLTVDDGNKIGVLPEPLFEPIFELFTVAAGDWLLDWLAVDAKARRQGIGGQLLDISIGKAKESGAAKISLVMEDSNQSAQALYASRGFVQRDQRAYIPFNQTSQTQNWLLLTAPVN